MSNAGIGALQGLSQLIVSRVEKQRDSDMRAKEEERQTRAKILTGALTSGNLSPEQIDQAMEELKKLYPKESHGLLDQFGGVLGKVFHARRVGQAVAAGQPTPTFPNMGGGTPSDKGGILNSSTGTTTTSPPAPSVSASVISAGYPGATARGTQAGQEAVAQSNVISAQRQKMADDLIKRLRDAKISTPEIEQEINAQAGGFQLRPPVRLSAITVEDPDHPGQRISANRNPFTGEVFKVDGTPITDPKIISATLGKPRKGWAKDAQGKFYSFNVDPITNQPMPGTEDYNELPPSGYLDHTRSGFYYYTDDSGNVHQVPYKTQSSVKTPVTVEGQASKGAGAGTSKDTSAIPPGMKPTSPAAKTAAPATPVTGFPAKPIKSDVIGTKDTGVLSPVGQKILMTTQPVLDQVDRLMAHIDQLGLKDNNESGYLLKQRALYAIGKAPKEHGTLGDDIAGLSLGSVVEAASALQGSSRSLVALKKALIHTPEVWLDSPKLLYNKLKTIKERLTDITTDAKKYGRKRATAEAVPPGMTGPSGAAPQNFDDVLDQVFGTRPTSNAPAQ